MALRLSAACVVIWLLASAAAIAAVERPPAEQLVVEAVNDARRAHGVRPLSVVPGLELGAARRARSMMERDAFGHLARIPIGAEFPTAGEALAVHYGWRARP